VRLSRNGDLSKLEEQQNNSLAQFVFLKAGLSLIESSLDNVMPQSVHDAEAPSGIAFNSSRCKK
jgi:hypothetical protein